MTSYSENEERNSILHFSDSFFTTIVIVLNVGTIHKKKRFTTLRLIRAKKSWNAVCVFSLYLLMAMHFLPIFELVPGYFRTSIVFFVFFVSVLGIVFDYEKRQSILYCLLLIDILFFVVLAYFGIWKIKDISSGVSALSRLIFLMQFWLYILLTSSIDKISVDEKRNIINALFALIILTIVTTVIGNILYNHSSRLLAGAASREQRSLFYKHNIGGYSFIYSLPVLVPYLLYLLDCRKRKFVSFLLVILAIVCVFISEYAICILGLAFGILMYYVFKSKHKIVLVFVAVVLFFVISDSKLLYDILTDITRFLNYYRITILADRVGLIRDFVMDNAYKNDLLIRDLLYQTSEDIFMSRPIFGCLFNPISVGGHSEVRDILAGTGVVGFSFFVLPIFFFINKARKTIEDRSLLCAFYSAIAVVGFISYFNTLFVAPAIGMMFFIMPLIIHSIETDGYSFTG